METEGYVSVAVLFVLRIFQLLKISATSFLPSVRQLTLYLGKRDYVDHVNTVDQVGTFPLQCVCEDDSNRVYNLLSLQMAS